MKTVSNLEISDPILRRLLYAIGIMGVIAFGFHTIGLLKHTLTIILNVLTPFLAAFLLSYILAPIVIALQQKLRMGRIMGTLVLYFLIFFIIFLVLAILIPKILSEFIKLYHALKAVIPILMSKLVHNEYFTLDIRLIELIQSKIKEIEVNYDQIAETLLPGLKNIATGGVQAVEKATKGMIVGMGSMVGFGSFLVFVGIISFYFIVDWEKIKPIVYKIVPPDHRLRVFEVLGKIDNAVGGFLRGQLTVCAIVGIYLLSDYSGLALTDFPGCATIVSLSGRQRQSAVLFLISDLSSG